MCLLLTGSYLNNQCHHCKHCYAAGTPGLELSYTFSNDHDHRVPDLSGNGRDGTAACERGPVNARIQGGDCSADGDAPPNVPCSLPGFGGYFDGSSDFVQLPALTRSDGLGNMYPEIQVDVWVKFHCTTGEHPVMNEDGWTQGDVHYQIYNSIFGFDINGNGDYAFQWQPEPMVWNYIAVFYSSTQQNYKLWTYRSATSSNPNPGAPVAEEYDPASDGRPFGYGFESEAPKGWVAVSLDSPRLGSWKDPNSRTARSLDGQLSVFRVWTAEQGGADTCPCQHAATLEAYYVFGESASTLRDLSKNDHDGKITGAKFGEDEPLSECVQEIRGLARQSKLTEHCMDSGTGNGVYFLLVVLGLGVVAGGWKFWESRPPGVGGGGGKKGLSSSLLEMDAVRTSGASAPAAPAAGSSGSDGGGGTIYD